MAAGAGADLDPELERAIDARLEHRVPATPSLRLAPGDTLLVEHTFTVDAARLGGRAVTGVEAIVVDAVTPVGVTVDDRADAITWKARGAALQVRAVVAVHADPVRMAGGPVRYSVALIERKGLGNTLTKAPFRARVQRVPARVTPTELARDFYGYRLYRNRALRKRAVLARQGLRVGLSGRVPALARASPRTVLAVREFERDRRRMAIALRHLEAARRSGQPELARQATRYLDNRDRPQRDWVDVPDVPLLAPARTEPEAPEAEPEPEFSETSEPDESGVLEPITTYQPGTEGPREPQSEPEPQLQRPPPLDPVIIDSSEERKADRSVSATLPGEFREEDLPNVPRGLRLEDPNVGFGGGARFVWAETELQESATSAAVFYFAQAALTRRLGLEATLPSQFVDLDGIRSESVYAAGNPMFALKYRFFLPEVEGRKPVLTLRARYAFPLAPPHKLRPTDITAETFTQQAFVVDTWAFLPEHHDLGVGTSFGWQVGWFTVSGQLHVDLFVPTEDTGLGEFFTLGWGMGVGALPFGDQVGGFAELRGVTFLRGTGRTEALTDIGIRGYLFDWLEPAVFLGLPIGSVAGRTSPQLGIELRIQSDAVARRKVSAVER